MDRYGSGCYQTQNDLQRRYRIEARQARHRPHPKYALGETAVQHRLETHRRSNFYNDKIIFRNWTYTIYQNETALAVEAIEPYKFRQPLAVHGPTKPVLKRDRESYAIIALDVHMSKKAGLEEAMRIGQKRKSKPKCVEGTKNRRNELAIVNNGDLQAEIMELPKFRPHDLRSLVDAAHQNDPLNCDHAVIFEIRRRNSEQMIELLRDLGIDPSQPDAWQRGFFLLAHFYHNVGNISWSQKRTNSNAIKWSKHHDLELIREVVIRKAQGLTERRAIATLAADPEKMRLFPYSPQKRRSDPRMNSKRQREATLWARLQHIKSSSNEKTLREALCGTCPNGGGRIERALHYLDNHYSLELVKNGAPQKAAHS